MTCHRARFVGAAALAVAVGAGLLSGCDAGSRADAYRDPAVARNVEESSRWARETKAADGGEAKGPLTLPSPPGGEGTTMPAASPPGGEGEQQQPPGSSPRREGKQTNAESSLSGKTTLEAVLRLAAAKSPMVKAAAFKWQAALQKRGQVVSLPDPMLEYRHVVRRMERGMGPERWSLGLSQTIPYPPKLIIGGRIADREAQAANLRYQAAVRDALAEAKEIYFEIYYIDRAQEVTEAVRRLYERYAALAAGGQEAGKTKLPELFRAETQRAQLAYDSILLKEMRVAEAERLRAALGLSAGAEIGPTEDVADPVPLSEKLETLHEVAARHNQELAAAGVEVDRSRHQVALAKRAPIPDLTVSAEYMNRVRNDPPMPNGGRDPVAVGLGVSIPIWFPKYRAMLAEARNLEQAALAEKEASGLKVRADLAKAFFSLSNSNRLVRLYRETLLPQARQAQQSAEELYRKGDASLASVLETTSTVHNFELARLRATADFYQNVARTERILGAALALKPAAPAPEEPQGGKADEGRKEEGRP